MSTRTAVVLNVRPLVREIEVPVEFVVEAMLCSEPAGFAPRGRADFGPPAAAADVAPQTPINFAPREVVEFAPRDRRDAVPNAWPVAQRAELEPPATVWGMRVAGWVTMLTAVLSVVLAYVFCDGAETTQLLVAEAAAGAFAVGAIFAWPRAT